MRAVVTGGSGFIGTHLVRRLRAEGWDVLNIDLAADDPHDICCSTDLVKAFTPDAVWHLAALVSVTESVRNPQATWDTNFMGTLAVLRWGLPTVFASTYGVYGDGLLPFREGQKENPGSPYAASKLAAETEVRRSVCGTVLRLANVYGPGQRADGEAGVVAILMAAWRNGSPPTLFGGGSPTRDYVHVLDVVEALVAARGHEGVFNVGTGVETPTWDVWEHITGGDRTYVVGELREGEVQRAVLNAELAARTFGWSPRISLEQGINDLKGEDEHT